MTQAGGRFVRDSDWVGFPGGELEGQRPRRLCLACREAIRRVGAASARPPRHLAVCFRCYRADFEREGALKAAGELETASVERFQTGLPFELVNRPRLEMLRAERTAARAAAVVTTAGKLADRRRQAQLAARSPQCIAACVALRKATSPGTGTRERGVAAAVHASELQLPESWLSFVVSQ